MRHAVVLASVAALICVSISVGLFGCNKEPAGSIVNYRDLKPDAPQAKKQVLVLGGTKLPVDVEAVNKAGVFEIDMMSNDVVIDKETYLVHGSEFDLQGMGEESFEPSMPLLKEGMHSRDTWTWEGKFTTGLQHPCSAKISTSSEKLYSGTQEDALLIDVKLSIIDSGGPLPAERHLRFWFVPGKGLVKREFGSGSIRQPVGE